MYDAEAAVLPLNHTPKVMSNRKEGSSDDQLNIVVPSPQKIVPSPRKFTEDPLCDVRNPRNGAAIFAVPRLNLLCSDCATSRYFPEMTSRISNSPAGRHVAGTG